MKKKIIFVLLIFTSINAHATWECTVRTTTKTFVAVADSFIDAAHEALLKCNKNTSPYAYCSLQDCKKIKDEKIKTEQPPS